MKGNLFKKIVFVCMTVFLLSVVSIPTTNFGIGVVTAEAATTKTQLNKKSVKLVKGQSYKLKLKNYTGKIKWTSSKKTIATVSASGKVTAKKKGTTTITAKAGSKKYKCKVTVQEPVINYKKLTVEQYDLSYQLKVKGTSFKPTFESSDEDIIYVGFTDGKLYPIEAGKATITIDINGKKYKCNVTVTKYCNTKIDVDCEDTITMYEGETKTINIKTDKGGSLTYNFDNVLLASATWEKWEGYTAPLTIKANKVGTTRLKIQDSNNSAINKNITINIVIPLPTITCDNSKTFIYPSKSGDEFRLNDFEFEFIPTYNNKYDLDVYVTGEWLSGDSSYWNCLGKIYDSNNNLVKSATLYLPSSMVRGEKVNRYRVRTYYGLEMGDYTFKFDSQAGYCYKDVNDVSTE